MVSLTLRIIDQNIFGSVPVRSLTPLDFSLMTFVQACMLPKVRNSLQNRSVSAWFRRRFASVSDILPSRRTDLQPTGFHLGLFLVAEIGDEREILSGDDADGVISGKFVRYARSGGAVSKTASNFRVFSWRPRRLFAGLSDTPCSTDNYRHFRLSRHAFWTSQSEQNGTGRKAGCHGWALPW